MPRSSRGSAPARRPAPAPARPQVVPPQPQHARPSSTAAAPTTTAHPPATQQRQGPGLFGQMASTAAGVAVGSSIGHAIGGFFGGGSSAPVEAEPTNATNSSDQFQGSGVCQTDVNNFRKCMNENGSDLNICGWYLDQLKACQAAASRY